MSKKKSYILCPKCGCEAFKLMSIEEIEKKHPEDKRLQLMMKRQYQCSDKENCANVFQVSLMDVAVAFTKMRLEEGKTSIEIVEEVSANTYNKLEEEE